MLVERGKGLDVEINALETKIQEAQAAGNTADVESLKKEHAGKSQQAVRIKALLYHFVNRPAMGGSNSGGGGLGETPQSQPQPQLQLAASNMKSDDTAPPMLSAPVSLPMEEHKPPVTDQRPPVTDQQALMHFMQARSGTTGFPSPEVAALHKLPNKTSTQVPTFSGSPNPRPAHLPASGSTSQHQSQPHHQSQPQPQASTSASSRVSKQWEGSFTFTIQHAGQPKGLEVQVTAVTNSKGQLYVTERSLWTSTNSLCRHTETWPERMSINMSQEGLKDHAELQFWLRRHYQTAVMVQFKPQARNFERKMNDMVYHVLMKTMADAPTASVPSILASGRSY
jgi:mediator of RNA polymerase II transcription subunit 25